jgi:hypothetical protein
MVAVSHTNPGTAVRAPPKAPHPHPLNKKAPPTWRAPPATPPPRRRRRWGTSAAAGRCTRARPLFVWGGGRLDPRRAPDAETRCLITKPPALETAGAVQPGLNVPPCICSVTEERTNRHPAAHQVLYRDEDARKVAHPQPRYRAEAVPRVEAQPQLAAVEENGGRGELEGARDLDQVWVGGVD